MSRFFECLKAAFVPVLYGDGSQNKPQAIQRQSRTMTTKMLCLDGDVLKDSFFLKVEPDYKRVFRWLQSQAFRVA